MGCYSEIKVDSDVTELMECACFVFFAFVYNSPIFTYNLLNKENFKLNHCHCQQRVDSVTDCP